MWKFQYRFVKISLNLQHEVAQLGIAVSVEYVNSPVAVETMRFGEEQLSNSLLSKNRKQYDNNSVMCTKLVPKGYPLMRQVSGSKQTTSFLFFAISANRVIAGRCRIIISSVQPLQLTVPAPNTLFTFRSGDMIV